MSHSSSNKFIFFVDAHLLRSSGSQAWVVPKSRSVRLGLIYMGKENSDVSCLLRERICTQIPGPGYTVNAKNRETRFRRLNETSSEANASQSVGFAIMSTMSEQSVSIWIMVQSRSCKHDIAHMSLSISAWRGDMLFRHLCSPYDIFRHPWQSVSSSNKINLCYFSKLFFYKT